MSAKDGAAPPNQSPRVGLLSGGLGSTAVLAMAKAEGFACHALSFGYGQRHALELEAAARVAEALGAASHRTVDVDLRAFGGSALTADIDVPKDRGLHEVGKDIPITYVPARNTLFLSFGLALCEVLGARDLFIGANALDSSGYPDCRPAFLAAFEVMANLGTRLGVEASSDAQNRGQGIRVRAPLLAMTKADIVRAGVALGVDYGATWSCYDPIPPAGGPTNAAAPRSAFEGAGACGRCDSCLLRQKGFREAGVPDPTPYAPPS
jgi:7-cyano-7-deazaguanine synthase